MTRALLVALFASAPALAVGVVAPIPRLPEADLKPAAVESEPAKPDDDPAKTIERIQKTAEAVGDRLKEQDTGTDTRKQQDQLLKDIDSLLKPPPPMNNNGGGGGGANNMPPPDMPPPDMPPPPSGMPPPMGGGMPPPMGGGSGRQRPNRGSRGEGEPKPMPMPPGAGGMNDPKPMPAAPMGTEPMPAATDPKNPGGTSGGTKNGGQKTPPPLPLDVSIAKEKWGELPEKLRQEVSQYSREHALRQYKSLLDQYFTSLAERERKGKK